MSVNFNENELKSCRFIIRQQGGGFAVLNEESGEIFGLAEDCETAVNITAALEQAYEEYNGLKNFAARTEAKAIFLMNGGSLV